MRIVKQAPSKLRHNINVRWRLVQFAAMDSWRICLKISAALNEVVRILPIHGWTHKSKASYMPHSRSWSPSSHYPDHHHETYYLRQPRKKSVRRTDFTLSTITQRKRLKICLLRSAHVQISFPHRIEVNVIVLREVFILSVHTLLKLA